MIRVGVLGPLAERHDIGRQPADWPQHHQPYRSPDHQDDDRRNRHDDGEEVAREPPHRLGQRRFVERDLQKGVIHRGRADHLQDIALFGEQGAESAADSLHHRRIAQIVGIIDDGRHFGDGEQAVGVACLQRDRLGADAVQYFAGELLGQHVVGRGGENQRRRIGRRQPAAQPIVAHRGDARHENHDLSEQREADRQQQQPGRQSETARAIRRGRAGRARVRSASVKQGRNSRLRRRRRLDV